MLAQAWLIPVLPIAAFLLIMVCGRFEPPRTGRPIRQTVRDTLEWVRDHPELL